MCALGANEGVAQIRWQMRRGLVTLIDTEGGDAHTARGMLYQMIAPDRHFRCPRVPIIHVPLGVVELGGDCADMKSG